MREVRIAPRAQLDLESIYIYLALEAGAPKAAQDIIDELYATFDRVAELPESGMRFTSDDLERDYRRVLVRQYWVYYSFDDSTLTVWRVFHTRQDIDAFTLVDY